MFVGAGLADGRPALASYTSDDLRHWSYTGLAAVGHEHDPWTGSAWECPQLVTVGDRALLLVAAWHAGETLHVMAGLGAYRAGQLTVDHWQRVGYGTGHYAPTTFTDLDGQPCALFWIREITDSSNSWAGALSIPYRIHLLDDRVEFRPHPAVTAALARLRDGHTTMTELVIGPTSQALTIPSEGGGELLRLDPHDGTVIVQAGPNSVAMPLPPDGEPIQVITDGAVLEVCTGIGLVGLSLTGRPVR
jgi:beta-fructofuranosidase